MKSTNIAATVGRFLGWGLILFGLLQLFAGGLIGGLWIMFIGWFLANAADASRREVALRQTLVGVRVKDVIGTQPPNISPDTSLDELIKDVFSRQQLRAVPVCDKGKSVGIVSITDVSKIEQAKWAETKVQQVMTKRPLYSVTLEDEITTALDIIRRNKVNQLLIEKEGRCNGLISLKDIQDYLRLKQELPV